MDTQDPIAIAKAQVAAFNDRDWNRFRSLMAPAAVYDEIATGQQYVGPDEIIGACQGWLGTMSDVRGTVTSSLAAGNTAVIEVTWSGTHDGPFEGPLGTTSPSGNAVETKAIQVISVSGDVCTGLKQYFDMLAMLGAMGALPGSRAAGA